MKCTFKQEWLLLNYNFMTSKDFFQNIYHHFRNIFLTVLSTFIIAIVINNGRLIYYIFYSQIEEYTLLFYICFILVFVNQLKFNLI